MHIATVATRSASSALCGLPVINAAVREHDMTYSVFMNGMKKAADRTRS